MLGLLSTLFHVLMCGLVGHVVVLPYSEVVSSGLVFMAMLGPFEPRKSWLSESHGALNRGRTADISTEYLTLSNDGTASFDVSSLL